MPSDANHKPDLLSMTLAFDQPAGLPSFVARIDPRWKLAAIVLAAGGLAWLQSLGPAVAGMIASLLLVAVARLPWSWYLGRLVAALAVYLLFFLWLPFVVEQAHSTWDLGFVVLSETGTIRLAYLSAKAVAMISLILVLVGTTALPNLLKAARSMYVSRLLVFLMLLAYRYVFLLIEEFNRLRIALRVRGFRNGADLHSYRTIGQVAGTLLVRSAERSERVGQAMRCRGFDGEFRSLDDFETAWPDVVMFLTTVGFAALLVTWDLMIR
ncbi:MAG: cobalt ECF transporter T component CbiQ [Planctomycetes bacterium]|nr:cobalt ECF transporter T component CbiQ [Planctomycetota bacterium]